MVHNKQIRLTDEDLISETPSGVLITKNNYYENRNNL